VKIGLTLPKAEPDYSPISRYEAIRCATLDAERGGFDSVWIFGHLLHRWQCQPTRGIWEAWTMLAALADEWPAFDEQRVGHLIVWKAPHRAEWHNLLAAALRRHRDGEPE
jgi:hypothetical protein